MIIIENGRRTAHIEGNHVKLMLRSNKRRAPRPVRHGERVLLTEADAWSAAKLWIKNAAIDFGDQEAQTH